MAIGNIDIVTDGRIEGWLFADGLLSRAYVTVNGRPARIVKSNTPRPDVERVLGVKGEFGFSAILPGSCHGSTTIALHAIDGDRIRLVRERQFDICHNDGFSSLDMEAAIATAREPGSVAIVVWDAAHNPAGRAKVLYDIVASRRPAVLFGFCHSEFGTRLWEPLRSTPIQCCLIRPEDFTTFRDQAQDVGLTFDTIWLCKPRLPTFRLAEALAHPGTAMVLDIDDNEEAFSRGDGSWGRAYGETSVNKAALYRDSIKVRSVASVSLQKHFGGEIVRHVRHPLPRPDDDPTKRASASESDVADADLRLIFIGTVRPHKGLLEAARAIRMAAYRHQLKITLTVGGTFDPTSLKDDLEAAGVETLGLVHSQILPATLTGYDAVLAGYPGRSRFDDVNNYQISSKVGDALQAGIPVLVPNSPATCDLATIPGVYLFDADTFDDALRRLVEDDRPPPELPDSFCVSTAYETFEQLEALAHDFALPAKLPSPKPPAGPNIVLLWKQNDSNLFGRRIDQIARLLASQIEGACIRVVEFAEARWLAGKDTSRTSAEALFRSETRRKINGLTENGVHFHSIITQPLDGDIATTERRSQPNAEAFKSFLQAHKIYPTNSIVIAFPLHYISGLLDDLLPALQSFQVIVDVVDNQLSWGDPERWSEKIADYRAFCDLATMVIFNSELNRSAMLESGIVEEAKTRLIPNWYIPPDVDQGSDEFWRFGHLAQLNVLYSGDLNNRIDWALLDGIAGLIGQMNGVLHLVGAGHRVQQELAHLLRRPHCIFHGAMRERSVLAIAEMCDFAVVPHEHNALSAFMNPLKIKMYAAVGLPHVVTDVPGIYCKSELTIVAQNNDEFLCHVKTLATNGKMAKLKNKTKQFIPPEATEYINFIKNIL